MVVPKIPKFLACNNRDAEIQRDQEHAMNLASLRRRYQKPSPNAGGMEMARAVEIASTINALAESIKILEDASTLEDIERVEEKLQRTLQYDGEHDQLQKQLIQATQRLLEQKRMEANALNEERDSAPEDDDESLDVQYYDRKYLPPSPRKGSRATTPRASPGKTPRHSNVTSKFHHHSSSRQHRRRKSRQMVPHGNDCILEATSSVLSAMGMEPAAALEQFTQGSAVQEYVPTQQMTHNHHKKKKRDKHNKGPHEFRLQFDETTTEQDRNKGIRIKQGDMDINIWAPGASGIILKTGGGGNMSSSDAVVPYGLTRSNGQPPQVFDVDGDDPDAEKTPEQSSSLEVQAKSRSSSRRKKGRSGTPGRRRHRSKSRKRESHPPIAPAMSNLSYMSGVIDQKGNRPVKFNSVKNDFEKGFEMTAMEPDPEVLLKQEEMDNLEIPDISTMALGSSVPSMVKDTLRQQQREIASIKKDLELCSYLLSNGENIDYDDPDTPSKLSILANSPGRSPKRRVHNFFSDRR